jgi:hypothetical protein
LTGLEHVNDLHWLPGGTLLLSEDRPGKLVQVQEQQPGRKEGPRVVPKRVGSVGTVTERNLDGQVLWKYEPTKHTQYRCARLLDGTTAVFWRDVIEVVRPDGTLAVRHDLFARYREFIPEAGLRVVGCIPDGRYLAFGASQGRRWQLAELNLSIPRSSWRIPLESANGEGLPKFDGERWDFPAVQRLPEGRYLVWGWRDGRGREIDQDGQALWQTPTGRSFAEMRRLRTGNTLFARGAVVEEVSRAGEVVWEAYARSSRTQFARPCLELVRLGFDAPYPRGFSLETSVEYQVETLRHREMRRRYAGAARLEALGPKVEAAVPALLGAIPGSSAEVRGRVESALGTICTEKSLPLLLRATKDASPEVREVACSPLYKFAKDSGDEVAPVLLRCLRDDSAQVRRMAASRLNNFPEQADKVVPALIAVLDDVRPEKGGTVAGAAAGSLARFPNHAKVIVPALIRMARSKDVGNRTSALHQLCEFPAFVAEIEPVFRAALTDENPRVQKQAKNCLQRIGR